MVGTFGYETPVGAGSARPSKGATKSNQGGQTPPLQSDYQLSFIQLDDPLLEEIKNDILKTDIDTLTPVEALMKLHTIKGLLQRKTD